MNTQTIKDIYETKTGSALYRAGYRLGRDGHWRRTIDSAGCGLSPREQDINRRGGRDYGSNADVILSREIADAKARIDGFDAEEIDSNHDLSWLAQWIRDATR
jgi:hypothetical protein